MNLMIRHFSKSFFKFLALFSILWACALPVVWLHFYYPHATATIFHIVAQNTLFFTLFRWLLIGSAVLFWPHFIASLAKKKQWKTEEEAFWQQQRWRIAGWLIIVEVLVCENGVLHLIKAF